MALPSFLSTWQSAAHYVFSKTYGTRSDGRLKAIYFSRAE